MSVVVAEVRVICDRHRSSSHRCHRCRRRRHRHAHAGEVRIEVELKVLIVEGLASRRGVQVTMMREGMMLFRLISNILIIDFRFGGGW